MRNKNDEQLTFGGHLEVLRRMLFRILGVVVIISLLIFLFKETIWRILLAPSEYNFITYRAIQQLIQDMGSRLSYKLCHDKKKHNFVTTQKNYEQQYGF